MARPALKDRKLDKNRHFAEHRSFSSVNYSQDGYLFDAAGNFKGKVPGYSRVKAKSGELKDTGEDKTVNMQPKRVIGARLSLDDVSPTVPPEIAKVRKENAAAEEAEKLA